MGLIVNFAIYLFFCAKTYNNNIIINIMNIAIVAILKPSPAPIEQNDCPKAILCLEEDNIVAQWQVI